MERIFYLFHFPDVFILSHFHIDHYNGLLYASIHRHKYPSFTIRKVYYPLTPKFKEREKFLYYLFAMNLRVFGTETGVMEYDLLKAVERINCGPFEYKPLSKGDVINIESSTFEVLWPPAVIDDKKTLSVIKKALKDFEKAIEEDKETKEIYNRVIKEGIFRDYLAERGGKNEPKEYKDRHEKREYEKREYEKRELPEVVKKSNKSLRKAANHLSLALLEDNRFLFLGDTRDFEIRQIVDDLKLKGRKNFYIFIAPHHGTSWDNSLKEIRCNYSIASNGSKLYSKMKPHFKKISKMSLATFVNGDIMIPIYLSGRF